MQHKTLLQLPKREWIGREVIVELNTRGDKIVVYRATVLDYSDNKVAGNENVLILPVERSPWAIAKWVRADGCKVFSNE